MNDRELPPPVLRSQPPGVARDRARPLPTVLMVCTGNICRSPMAELMLRGATDDLGIRVRSAGTRALVGRRMPHRARVLAIRHGAPKAEVKEHRGRWLDDSDLADARLLLGMSGSHVRACVERAPRLLQRAFTAREFARLSAGLSDAWIREAAESAGDATFARIDALIGLVNVRRASSPATSADDDILDPYKEGRRAYDVSAAQLAPVIKEVDRTLRAALG